MIAPCCSYKVSCLSSILFAFCLPPSAFPFPLVVFPVQYLTCLGRLVLELRIDQGLSPVPSNLLLVAPVPGGAQSFRYVVSPCWHGGTGDKPIVKVNRMIIPHYESASTWARAWSRSAGNSAHLSAKWSVVWFQIGRSFVCANWLLEVRWKGDSRVLWCKGRLLRTLPAELPVCRSRSYVCTRLVPRPWRGRRPNAVKVYRCINSWSGPVLENDTVLACQLLCLR